MLKYYEIDNTVIAELSDENVVISQTADILDIMGDCLSKNCNRIIIRESNLNPDFFRLHTGLAGDILQKFSNYNFILAVIGDFTKYVSNNFQDFIRESNKGKSIFFLENMDDAVRKLLTGRIFTE
jgi:hypothetical protein